MSLTDFIQLKKIKPRDVVWYHSIVDYPNGYNVARPTTAEDWQNVKNAAIESARRAAAERSRDIQESIANAKKGAAAAAKNRAAYEKKKADDALMIAQAQAQETENQAAAEVLPAAVETQAVEASPVVVNYYTQPRTRVNMKTLFIVGGVVFACWMIFGRR